MKFPKIGANRLISAVKSAASTRTAVSGYKDAMLYSIASPIHGKYELMRKKTLGAIAEVDIGFVDSETIAFFEKTILGKFFKKNEKGYDLLAKNEIAAIVCRWKAKQFYRHDAMWLEEEFLPFLAKCEKRDLIRIGCGGIMGYGETIKDKDKDGVRENNKENTAAASARGKA
jgi:hypothetical protein